MASKQILPSATSSTQAHAPLQEPSASELAAACVKLVRNVAPSGHFRPVPQHAQHRLPVAIQMISERVWVLVGLRGFHQRDEASPARLGDLKDACRRLLALVQRLVLGARHFDLTPSDKALSTDALVRCIHGLLSNNTGYLKGCLAAAAQANEQGAPKRRHNDNEEKHVVEEDAHKGKRPRLEEPETALRSKTLPSEEEIAKIRAEFGCDQSDGSAPSPDVEPAEIEEVSNEKIEPVHGPFLPPSPLMGKGPRSTLSPLLSGMEMVDLIEEVVEVEEDEKN